MEGGREISSGYASKYVEWSSRSLVLGLGNVTIFKSPKFSFLDSSWNIQCQPNYRLEYDSWSAMYLVRDDSHTSEHFVTGHIGIKRNGTQFNSHTFQHTFTCNSCIYSIDKFVKMSDFWNMVHLDNITFFCWLRSNKEVYPEVGTQTLKFIGEQKLAQDFRDLLYSGEGTDIILSVQGRNFRAHRVVLIARSSVFAAMLKHDMRERNSGVVLINDCNPDCFEIFLEHLYTGTTEKYSEDSVIDLYEIADKYDIPDLKDNCVNFLLSILSVETFCEVAQLALQYNESALLKEVAHFFARNIRKITASSKWQIFLVDYPLQANEFNLKALEYHGIHE